MPLDPHAFHIDTFLSNFLIGYRPRNLVATEIFPVLPVQKQSNVYARIDKGNWFRIPDTARAPGGPFREVNYTVSSGLYFASNYALQTSVPFEVLDNADQPHDPLARNAEFLVDQLMLDFENRVKTLVLSGVGSSATLTGAAAWSDFVNSDPLTNIDTGREAIRSTTGFVPNVAVMGERAWLKMKRHPDIVRAVYPGAGVGGTVDTGQFAELIGVDKVLVGGAIQNTAPEMWNAAGNDATQTSFSDVWSTFFIMAYVAPEPGIMTPTFGTAFRWTGPNIGANGPGNFSIERKRNTDLLREELRTAYWQDERVVAPELGYSIITGIQ